MERRKADFKAGKALVISGREVFEFRPELVNDDDEEADDTRYIQGTGGDEVRGSFDSQVYPNGVGRENRNMVKIVHHLWASLGFKSFVF